MSALFQEVRFAIRSLRKKPGYAVIAIVTIALGIGANSAIFNVVNAALIRPLPYANSDRLLIVGETIKQRTYPGQVSYGDYQQLKRETRTLEEVAGYGFAGAMLTGYGDAEMLQGGRVTASFLPLLGVQPKLGRNFTPGEESGAGAPAIILSDALWRQRFQANTSIVGTGIRLDGDAYTVVGVLPADFQFAKLGAPQFLYPLRPKQVEQERRYFHWMYALGRMKPGVTVEQAQAELNEIARHFGTVDPTWHKNSGLGAIGLQRDIVGKYQPILLMLMGAVGFVLLIACANVANLMLARTSGRQKEIATRAALGATRWQIARLLLVESCVLAFAGAVLGIVWSAWCNNLLIRAIPEAIRKMNPFLDRPTFDARVIFFAAGLAIVVGVLFGALPALRFSREDVSSSLKSAASNISGTRGFVYDGLIVGEVALALVLLAGAGLLTLSLSRLIHADPGFEANGLVTTRVTVPLSYKEPAQIREFHRSLLEKLQEIPGVEGVATTDTLPLTGQGGTGSPKVVGRDSFAGRDYQVDLREVSAQYFQVMRIPLVDGRAFDQRDVEQNSPAVIINRQLASELFHGSDPVGQRVTFVFTGDTEWQIVGVVGNESVRTLDAPNIPALYFHYTDDRGLNLMMRTSNPSAMESAVRSAVAAVDPNVPVQSVQTMQQVVDESPVTFMHRYPAILISGFGVLALVLALVGIYGVVAYSVARRTKEIGIRIALGARASHVLDAVLRRNIILTLCGLGLGTIATYAMGNVMQGLLFGVRANDSRIIFAAVVMLGTISLVASYIPARRATNVDPMVSLREE